MRTPGRMARGYRDAAVDPFDTRDTVAAWRGALGDAGERIPGGVALGSREDAVDAVYVYETASPGRGTLDGEPGVPTPGKIDRGRRDEIEAVDVLVISRITTRARVTFAPVDKVDDAITRVDAAARTVSAATLLLRCDGGGRSDGCTAEPGTGKCSSRKSSSCRRRPSFKRV